MGCQKLTYQPKLRFINGAPAGYTYHNDNYTAYVGGHFEVKEGRFTKHYFNGAERLASKIGVGTLDNSAAKGYYQAGGIDYGKRYADAYKDFKQIAKEQGLPPGPPNLKFIYAQQALADERANSELVANLILLNNLSLADWQQQNTEKDPGPPICDDVFCGTGGNIDTGSLPENDIYFFHPDHLGSTSYITNIAGETVQFNTYMPFGETFVSQQRTTTISAYLFNSKEKDPETGLYYYGARYYNSKTSVWLSVDPLVLRDEVVISPQTTNGGVFNSQNNSVYSFSYQNPVKYVDPDGECPACVVAAVWVLVEVGLSIYDAYDTVKTLFFDNDATKVDKGVVVGGLIIGIFAPGGGYGTAGKKVGKELIEIGGKNVDNIDDFYKAASKLSPGERVAKFKNAGKEIAEKNNWKVNKSLSKKNNGRDIYTDKDGHHYSLDTQHGEFEILDKKGKHKGAVDFGGKLKGEKLDKSGGHDIKI